MSSSKDHDRGPCAPLALIGARSVVVAVLLVVLILGALMAVAAMLAALWLLWRGYR